MKMEEMTGEKELLEVLNVLAIGWQLRRQGYEQRFYGSWCERCTGKEN